MKANGINAVIDSISVIDANGTKDSSGVIDLNVQWHGWNVEETSPINGAIGTIVAIGAIVAIGTIIWSMYHHCLQWIVIVANGANVDSVAIFNHFRQWIAISTVFVNIGANGVNGKNSKS